jgi:tRNA nucleotidyltransferase/poly(A) polymerase
MGGRSVYGQVIAEWLAKVPLWSRVIGYLQAEGVRAYLVGGTVRDALLGRQSCDLDIAVEGQAMSLARRLADALRAAYVPLDSERDVARVVSGSLHLDLAALRAANIEADLWARDFTVNAMAISLDDPLGALIDPVGGERDLAARLLRIVREDAFAEDPLRILRAVRLRGALGFRLTPESEALARTWLPALRRASAERIRDELVQVLALPDAADSLAYADALGMCPELFPELSREAPCARATRAVATLERLFGACAPGGKASSPRPSDAPLGLLARFRPSLAEHWSQELSSGRARWPALKLASFLSVARDAAAIGRETALRLRFSAREVRFISTALGACDRLLAGREPSELTRLETYRYFREAKDAGVDGAILSLVRQRAELQDGAEALAWKQTEQCTGALLDAWFCQHTAVVDPPQLLSGDDLQHALGVSPGPELGALLQVLREAQVQRLVSTRSEALEFLRGYLRHRS